MKRSWPEAGLLVAVATGTWLLVGFLAKEGYYAAMGVPSGGVWHAPQQYALAGFQHVLGMLAVMALFAGVALLLLLAANAFRRRMGEDPFAWEGDLLSILRPASTGAFAAAALASCAYFALAAFVPLPDRSPLATAGALQVDAEDLLLLGAIVVAGLLLGAVKAGGALLLTHVRRRVEAHPFVVALFTALLLSSASLNFGRLDAEMTITGPAVRQLVLLHAPDAPGFDNRTFLFVARTSEGYYLRDLATLDVRGTPALFVSASLVESAEFSRVGVPAPEPRLWFQ
ncbi:MAG TPA: hypothetical protein VHH36_07405 [Candidatus Thermoplasmatota archaeon]|nr:hypothetical protein [Candidatus Thermoplasmatota archaeon]